METGKVKRVPIPPDCHAYSQRNWSKIAFYSSYSPKRIALQFGQNCAAIAVVYKVVGK